MPTYGNANNNVDAFYRNVPIHHHAAQMMNVMAALPSLTMRATSMSCLMDDFLASQYISVKHLTFRDTNHFNILNNEGLHQFNT